MFAKSFLLESWENFLFSNPLVIVDIVHHKEVHQISRNMVLTRLFLSLVTKSLLLKCIIVQQPFSSKEQNCNVSRKFSFCLLMIRHIQRIIVVCNLCRKVLFTPSLIKPHNRSCIEVLPLFSGNMVKSRKGNHFL